MKRVSKKDIGKTMKGRVMSYDKSLGYGYILTEDGTDIFLSSYALGSKEKRVNIGTLVEFKVGTYNDKVVAENVNVLERYKNGIKKFLLPNGKEVALTAIKKFGKTNAFKTISKRTKITEEDLVAHGYKVEDLDYIFVNLPDGEYMFFGETSPVHGDGKYDINKLYNQLCELIAI